MALEDLPIELIMEILDAIDDPMDLHRLIQSSPVCLLAFNTNPHHFVSQVIRNDLENDTNFAVSLRSAPQFLINDVKRMRKASKEFLEEFFEDNEFLRAETLDIISRFLIRVSKLVNKYVRRAKRDMRSELMDDFSTLPPQSQMSPGDTHWVRSAKETPVLDYLLIFRWLRTLRDLAFAEQSRSGSSGSMAVADITEGDGRLLVPMLREIDRLEGADIAALKKYYKIMLDEVFDSMTYEDLDFLLEKVLIVNEQPEDHLHLR